MASRTPNLRFCISPKLLPKAQDIGRVVCVDVAFAHGDRYAAVTRPFITELGDRLVRWIDHHPHPGWAEVEGDPRFVLVDKTRAPACPELISEELCADFGALDDVLAHADFDGCVAAVKVLRGGSAPYPEADEDARAVDAPGRGFELSPRGERLALAIEEARAGGSHSAYARFLRAVAGALVEGHEPDDLRERLDAGAGRQRARNAELDAMALAATRPHPEVLMLRAPTTVTIHERKMLVLRLEERARVGVLVVGDQITVATFDTESLDLRSLPGLEGGPGLVWGRADANRIVQAVLSALGRA